MSSKLCKIRRDNVAQFRHRCWSSRCNDRHEVFVDARVQETQNEWFGCLLRCWSVTVNWIGYRRDCDSLSLLQREQVWTVLERECLIISSDSFYTWDSCDVCNIVWVRKRTVVWGDYPIFWMRVRLCGVSDRVLLVFKSSTLCYRVRWVARVNQGERVRPRHWLRISWLDSSSSDGHSVNSRRVSSWQIFVNIDGIGERATSSSFTKE